MDSNIKQIVNVINGIGMLNFHYNSNGDSIEFDSNLKDLNSVTKQLEIELKNFMYLFNEQIQIKADDQLFENLSKEIYKHISTLKDNYHQIRVIFSVPISKDIIQLLKVIELKISVLDKILNSISIDNKFLEYHGQEKTDSSSIDVEENVETLMYRERYDLLKSKGVINLINSKIKFTKDQHLVVGTILGIDENDAKKLQSKKYQNTRLTIREKADKLNLRQRYYLVKRLGVEELIYSKVRLREEQHKIIGKMMGVHKDNIKKLFLDKYKGVKISPKEKDIVDDILSKISK